MTADSDSGLGTEYIPPEPMKDPAVRQRYWDTAIGLQKVDGLEPSSYLYRLAESHVRGELDLDEVRRQVDSYHGLSSDVVKKHTAEKDVDTLEADVVSEHIVEVLSRRAFSLVPGMLKSIHAELFQDLDPAIYHPGLYKGSALIKQERILNGDSVLYADPDLIEQSLALLFSEELGAEYGFEFNADEAAHFSRFIARLWQVHPFVEGNTRTIAVFAELYLDYLGHTIEQNAFKDEALYFRNALVRANYRNAKAKIMPDLNYLSQFIAALVHGGDKQFDNSALECRPLFENPGLLRNVDPSKAFCNLS